MTVTGPELVRVVPQSAAAHWLGAGWVLTSLDVWTDRVVARLAQPGAPFPEQGQLPRSLDGRAFRWALVMDGTRMEQSGATGGWRDGILFLDVAFGAAGPVRGTGILEASSPGSGEDGLSLSVTV